MKIQLVSIEKEGIIHLGVDGKITAHDFSDGNENPIEKVIGVNWAGNRVLMDMRNVNYADSSAIGWLLKLQKGFKAGGGALVLYGITPSVMQLFTLLNLKGVFTITENEAAARERLTPTRA
jgi:anti-anti-sigma factor